MTAKAFYTIAAFLFGAALIIWTLVTPGQQILVSLIGSLFFAPSSLSIMHYIGRKI